MVIIIGAAVLVIGVAGALVLTHAFGHSAKASHTAADKKPVGPPLPAPPQTRLPQPFVRPTPT